jgi:protein gp37
MAENSKINWTTHTFNPWIGCTKVSPGCLHCYAETLMDTRYGRVKWGAGNPRSRTAPSNWKKVRSWNNHAGRDAVRPRVFCASLADWLDDEVPVEWLRDLLVLVQTNPHLDWLLLTKRPQNWSSRVHAAFVAGWDGDEWASQWLDGDAPSNVWVGTTVEDQTRADERIPNLISIPARVRFLSCEPLLGPLEIEEHLDDIVDGGYVLGSAPIHWVICGGESGPGARVMQTEWADSLREQCAAAGVPFWMKQMGGAIDSRHELSDLPESLRIRELPTA